MQILHGTRVSKNTFLILAFFLMIFIAKIKYVKTVQYCGEDGTGTRSRIGKCAISFGGRLLTSELSARVKETF